MSRALRPFGVIALVAALARAADVTGENCGHIPESGQRCSGMLEYVLVVDNSWSLHERYEELSEFMRRVVDSFQLDVQSPFSPRVSIVTLSGAGSEPPSKHSQVLHPLSGNSGSLNNAIDKRPAPTREKGFTCISCGLDLAASIIKSTGRSEAKPMVMVLTDGEQTVWGGNPAAVGSADALKDSGVDVVALSLGANSIPAACKRPISPLSSSPLSETQCAVS